MMKAQSLRNAILQLAVQGKLIPQNSGDEPASVLLQKIKAERELLIKDKRIKAEKPLSEITDDEKPFAIPKDWEWVRLGDLLYKLTDGTHATPKYLDSGVPFLSVKDMSTGKISFNDTKFISHDEHAALFKRCNPEFGDILLTKVGTTGIPVIVDTKKEFSLFVSVALLKFNKDLLFNEFLVFLIKSPLVKQQCVENTKGVGNKNLVLRDIANSVIPLPPLAEQQRIVAKIEQLMPLIDKYDLYQQELFALDKEFPQDLKKSILQFAVQGKLVAQDKADEPASVLLQKINLEKKQLLKDKKIKAEKPLPEITEDEKPFAIPESWEWVRLGELGDIVGGGTPKTQNDNYWNNGNIPWLTPADMSRIHGKLVERGSRMITNEGLLKSSARLLPKNSIIYSSRAPIGYIGIASNELCTNQGFKSLVPINNEIVEYLYYSLIQKTPDIQSRASGTTFKEISGSEFALTVLPLPPLAEQQRIVAKVESLMALCEILKDESKLMKYEIPTKLGRIITFTHETTEGYEPEHLIAARAEVIRPETQQKQQERIALMRKKK